MPASGGCAGDVTAERINRAINCITIQPGNRVGVTCLDLQVKPGEIIEPKRRLKDIETDEPFFEGLIADPKFNAYVEKK